MKKIVCLLKNPGIILLGFIGCLFTACSKDFELGPDFGNNGCFGCGGSLGTSIYIMGSSFAPYSLEIQKGKTVTWYNTDTIGHNIICNDFAGPFIADLAPGGEYKYTAYNLGTFRYYCNKHGESGELKVVP